MANYKLQEFTKGDVRTETKSVMPSSSSKGTVQAISYWELNNWLLRAMVDEAAWATLVKEFTHAHQGDNEDELSFA